MLRTKDEVVDFVETLINEEWSIDEPLMDAIVCYEDGFVNFAMVLHELGDGDEDEIAVVFDKVAERINGGYRDWLVRESDRPTRWMAFTAREVCEA